MFYKNVSLTVAKQLFRVLDKYRPETRAARKARLRTRAQDKAKGKADTPTKRIVSLKQGANSVVRAIEQKKAQLVVIAHDVDPIEVSVIIIFKLSLQLNTMMEYEFLHLKPHVD